MPQRIVGARERAAARERTTMSFQDMGLHEALTRAVFDSGIGIAPSQMSIIFDKFAQADLSIARRFGGTGLGLSISSHLARLMGGQIEFTSTLGEGTIFFVTLPLRIPAEDCPQSVPSDSTLPAPAPPAWRPRVRVAEDHDINQELMLAIAARIGVVATIAPDGEDAISKIEAADRAGTPCDLVLMDMQMPKLDGLETTRRLRAAGYGSDRLPIVALTANAYADDITACMEAGMQLHLSKPVSAEDLVAVLGRFVPDTRQDQGSAAQIPLTASLDQRYLERKIQLFAQINAIAHSPEVSDKDVAALASALHQFSGVAGMFGEPELGGSAAALEAELKTTKGDALKVTTREWLRQFDGTDVASQSLPAPQSGK